MIKPDSVRFSRAVAGLLLLAGSAMTVLGWLMHPVAIDKHIEAAHVAGVAQHEVLWVWSFRFLVFGLFLRLAGLVSFGTLFSGASDRAILLPSIAVASAGLAIGAIGKGYYMDLAIHAAWRFANDASTDSARIALLGSLMPMTEWVACLERMGAMFLALGTLGASLALWRSVALGRSIAMLGALFGVTAMMLLMARPDGSSLRIVFGALAAWHLLLGALTLRWKD